jgi:hypothetical protein
MLEVLINIFISTANIPKLSDELKDSASSFYKFPTCCISHKISLHLLQSWIFVIQTYKFCHKTNLAKESNSTSHLILHTKTKDWVSERWLYTVVKKSSLIEKSAQILWEWQSKKCLYKCWEFYKTQYLCCFVKTTATFLWEGSNKADVISVPKQTCVTACKLHPGVADRANTRNLLLNGNKAFITWNISIPAEWILTWKVFNK